MKRNRHLALAISDVSFAEFKRQMSYKTVWQGEALFLADRWFPSTKLCSCCGHIKEDMDLAERVYVCDNPLCLLVIERDLNAALNLVALANEVLKLAQQDPTQSLKALFHEVMANAMKAVKVASSRKRFYGEFRRKITPGGEGGAG